jgi:DNA-binding transcriptional LysR family regulator
VGVGILPESAARRHALTMAIRIVPLRDAWSVRNLSLCVRQLDALPLFARDLVERLVADAEAAARTAPTAPAT